MKKILLVAGKGNHSGVPVYVNYCFKLLSKRFNVDVVGDKNEGGFSEIPNYIEIEGLSSDASLLRKVLAFVSLYRLLKRSDYDFVWANSSFSVLFSRVLSLFFNYLLIVTYHGVPFGPGRKKLTSKVAFWVERISIRFVNQYVILISKKDSDLITPLIGKRRSELIPNCAVVSADSIKETHCCGPFRFVMTTRYCHQKDLFRAALAISELAGCTLSVIGNVPYKEQGELKNVCDNIEFLGVIPNAFKLLRFYDCYLLSSRYEGLPIGAIEALLVGLPVVMSDVGGYEEISSHSSWVRKLPVKLERSSSAGIKDMLVSYRQHQRNIRDIQESAEYFNYERWEGDVFTFFDKISD